MRRAILVALLLVSSLLAAPRAFAASDVYDRVHDHYVDNNGVRIHYVTLGRRGPLLVMIHGFPDFWYTWRDQMAALSRHYRIVAIDQRGYNLSDHPAGVEQYDILVLASDVAAVIRDAGEEQAVVIGHDWGGGVAWTFAMIYPAMTQRLIILNTPHPRALIRELRENPAQQAASEYARRFQQDGAEQTLTPQILSAWVTDPAARARYVEAFQRSDIGAMLNYYKRNYPRAPYDDLQLPAVQARVLIIYGLTDPFLLPAALNGTWQFLTQGLTLVTVPGVGHFVQQDASALVTRTIKQWLDGEDLR
jgi:pimeloyl-ACP methyl ester carboxylesterase